jgi:hypothetical protein
MQVHAVCFTDLRYLISQLGDPFFDGILHAYIIVREVESFMKSVAPIRRRTIRTGRGNLRRVGSCTMVGAESKCRTPRLSTSHPPAARTFLTHSLSRP